MATTPTEWYTSLPGVESVRAPENRSGAGGGGFPRSPLEGNFHKQRRALQNALAKKQLEMMQEKLKQAREGTLQQREDRILAPIKEAYARANAPRPPRKAPTGTDYGTTAKSFFDMMGGQRKPGDVRAMADWLKFIGPGRAHAGMMQTGKLLGGQGGGGVILGPEEEQTPIGMSGSPGATPPPRGTRVGPGGVPLSREKGGTIPETGPYELHEGEIVISADQVDRPLMAALKQDKLGKIRTGQMDGKGTGPGPPTAKSMVKDEFMGGTLHSYQAGTGEHTPEFVPWQRSFAEGGEEDFPGVAEDSVMAQIMAYLRPDPEGNPQFMENKPGSPGETEALLDEALGDATPARPYPLPGKSFQESRDEYGENYQEKYAHLGQPGAPSTNYYEQNVRDNPESQLMDQLLSMKDDPGYQQEMRDEQGAAANEATFQQAAGGDRGLGEAGPLTIQKSGPLEQEEIIPGGRNDPRVKDREKREFNAAMNEMKADRLQDYLASNGPDMDPQTFKHVQDQANQLKSINKSERDRQTLKDENAKDRITEMENVYTDYQGQLARAQATGQASLNVGLRQEKSALRNKLETYELKFLEGVEDGWSRDVLGAYVDAMFDIKAKLEGVEPGDENYQENRNEYINYQMSVLGEQ